MRRGAGVGIGLTLVLASATPVFAESSGNPCDSAPLPVCTGAIGTLKDVTRQWRAYQPALLQAVPLSDYAADPETAVFGACGTETSSPASNGEKVPASSTSPSMPAGIPTPPGVSGPTQGPYCLLRYIPADFPALCAGCVRILIDYTGIPATDLTTDPVSPGSDGHFALRLTPGQSMSVRTPFNGHSPNVKNLCSDKFFNPSAGADCANPIVAGFDEQGLGLEGDTGSYHHLTLEGRYFNGPAYLAGDGRAVPYHWVRGAIVDLDYAGATEGLLWYAAGYRGKGDVLPDTDQSYACACEVPPFGHSSFSATVALRMAPMPPTPPTPVPRPSSTPPAHPVGLPATSGSPFAPPTFLVALAALAILGAVRAVRPRRTVRRRGA